MWKLAITLRSLRKFPETFQTRTQVCLMVENLWKASETFTCVSIDGYSGMHCVLISSFSNDMRPGSCDPLVIVWTIWTLKFRVSFLRYLPTWTENRIPKKGLNQRFGDKRRTEIKSWNQRQSILEKIKVSDGKETKVKFSYFIPLKRTKVGNYSVQVFFKSLKMRQQKALRFVWLWIKTVRICGSGRDC